MNLELGNGTINVELNAANVACSPAAGQSTSVTLTFGIFFLTNIARRSADKDFNVVTVNKTIVISSASSPNVDKAAIGMSDQLVSSGNLRRPTLLFSVILGFMGLFL